MEVNNIFVEGMNSDMSKIYQSNKQYLKAIDLRPVGLIGGSVGALVNIKGTNCEASFPTLRNIFKLGLIKTEDGEPIEEIASITITINGQTTSPITLSQATTTQDIVNYIKLLPNIYNGTYTALTTFAVSYNSNFIFIYQNPEYKTCSSIESVDPAITIDEISPGPELVFYAEDGSTSTTSISFIPAVTNGPLVIIGSTYIGEIEYLFTCPATNPNNLGQIWESTYNDLTQETTIKLIYNNILNFHKEFPIPPSACIGRFELPSLQRIYWSDNNNAVRSMNIKDPNTIAIDIDLIDNTPSIDMSIPTLNAIIDSGAIVQLSSQSTYQCAYRLVKSNGSISNYSIASNIVVPIIQPTSRFISPSPGYGSLNGDIGTVDKSIKWEVNGVDTDYDTIEFVIIIRTIPAEDNFLIYKYETQLVNGQSTITSIFTNDVTNFEEVSRDEFLIENTAFTHAKTLEQKDNRLFFANVRNGLSEYLDTFDTRAFRFSPTSDNIIIKNFETDTIATTIALSGNNYSTISETADVVPVFNLGMDNTDDPLYDGTCKYQRNSTIIGGTGLNISYKFGSLLLASDTDPLTPQQNPLGSSQEGSARDTVTSQLYPNGYRRAGAIFNVNSPLVPYYSNLAPNQKYYTNLARETLGLEYFNGTYRTGELNEIYRYGIRFVAKNGNGHFVKWIGDIKFPNYSDSVAPGLEGVAEDNSLCSDFRSLYYSGQFVYSNIPYIQFEINIPDTLSKLIGGYEIVRVRRKDADMSITSQGLINQISQEGYNPTSPYYTASAKIGFSNPRNGTSGFEANERGFTYHPFKQIVDQSASLFNNTDKVIITEKYNATTNTALWPINSVPSVNFAKHWYIRKFYNFISNYYDTNNANSSIFKVNAAIYAPSHNLTDPAQTLTGLSGTVGGDDYYNRDNASNTTGSECIAISTTDSLQWIFFGNDVVDDGTGTTASGSSKLLAIHFKPTVLQSQYGGRTYLSRLQNEYISCGAFYKVDTAGTELINVFGGDVFYGILDIQKEIKEDDVSVASNSKSQTWFFPTHSRYNLDVRSGAHVNCDLNDDVGAVASALYGEAYFYTKSFSYENSLYTYIPQPFNFNSTSSFFNRVYWSEVKTNGENSDSWTSVPIINFHDVDGNYGGITALITLNSNMHFIQESAIGLLLINQQSLMTDQNNQTIKVGVGDTLNKHIYHSVDIGSKHQWSIYKSNDNITFCDIRHKKLYLFNGQKLNPISDAKGNRGFLNKTLHDAILVGDNPIIGIGILTTYDFANNEFLYTFKNQFTETANSQDEGGPLSSNTINEAYTLVYSDLVQAFSSFYSATPYIYINNHNRLYSSNSYTSTEASKIHLHNVGQYGSFYGIIYPSSLKLNINPMGLNTKVYDNLSWISESIADNINALDDINNNRIKSLVLQEPDNINHLEDTFSRVRCYNEYQNSDWVTLDNTPETGNLRKSEQGFNIQVPRNKFNYDIYPINTYSIFDTSKLTKTEFGDRFRDKYIIVDLEYDNLNNNRFIIHNLKTTCRVSDR